MMAVGDEWWLTPQRAALHRPTGTIVVADLHLGYGRARQATGDSVPELPVASVMAPLERLKSLGATRLLIAGDLFEAGYRRAVVDDLVAWCRDVALELVGLVPGNHDRNLVGRDDLPLFGDDARLGGWRVLHGDGAIPSEPCIHGHDHPCLRISGRVRTPCYLVSPTRIVLPAFSRDAAGGSVAGVPRWAGFRCAAIVGDEVLDFGDAATLIHRLAKVMA